MIMILYRYWPNPMPPGAPPDPTPTGWVGFLQGHGTDEAGLANLHSTPGQLLHHVRPLSQLPQRRAQNCQVRPMAQKHRRKIRPWNLPKGSPRVHHTLRIRSGTCTRNWISINLLLWRADNSKYGTRVPNMYLQTYSLFESLSTGVFVNIYFMVFQACMRRALALN